MAVQDFNSVHPVPNDRAGTGVGEKIDRILNEFGSGEPQRRNAATAYVAGTAPIFRALAWKGPAPPPKCVQVEITNKCSTNCQMCGRYLWTMQKDYTPQKELTAEQQVALFEHLASIGIRATIWTGGEPMTHPHLHELLAGAAASGLRIGILSNGVGIDSGKAESLVRHANWLRISLDDVPRSQKPVRRVLRQYTDERHGEISSEVEKSLANLRKAIQRGPARDFRLGFAFTIQKNNAYDIPAMAAYAAAAQVPVTFKLAHGCEAPFLCDRDELEWVQNSVLSNPDIVDNPYVNIAYLRDYFFQRLALVDIQAGLPTRSYYRDSPTICFTPYLFSLIDAFGDVHVCCHLYDDNGAFRSQQRATYRIGNITDDSFIDVWRSRTYEEMRAALKPIDVDETPCGGCTRHWIPNTVVTRLYNEVFLPMVDEAGPEAAIRLYSEVVEDYPEEAVWF